MTSEDVLDALTVVRQKLHLMVEELRACGIDVDAAMPYESSEMGSFQRGHELQRGGLCLRWYLEERGTQATVELATDPNVTDTIDLMTVSFDPVQLHGPLKNYWVRPNNCSVEGRELPYFQALWQEFEQVSFETDQDGEALCWIDVLAEGFMSYQPPSGAK